MSPKIARKDVIASKLSPTNMITRKQNVRHQRQIKNESILRISQMTQMLKSPINSKYNYEQPKTITSNKVLKSPKKSKITYQSTVRNGNPMNLSEKLNNKKKYKIVMKHVIYSAKTTEEPKAPVPMKTYINKTISPVSNSDQSREAKKILPEKVPETVISSKPDSELSVEELIRLHEIDDMSEEDLMEILTCPSPVWWEDPPHEYNNAEDAISINNEVKIKYVKHVENKRKANEQITINNTLSNKFISKRNKLENLLSTMKNKRQNVLDSEVKTITRRRRRKRNKNKLIRNTIVKETIGDVNTETDIFFSLQNDIMLNNLENIIIPIQKTDVSYENEDKSVLGDVAMSTISNAHLTESVKQSEKGDCKDTTSLDEKNKKLKIMSIEKCIEASPISIKSISTENEMQEDAISDTNIKFIYDDSGSQNSITFDNADISETDNDTSESKTEKAFGLKIQNADKINIKTKNSNSRVNKKEEKSDELNITTNPELEPKTFGLTIQKLNDTIGVSQQKVKMSPRKVKINNKDRKRQEIMNVYKIITGEQFNKDEMKSIAAKEKSKGNIEKIIKSNYATNDCKMESNKTTNNSNEKPQHLRNDDLNNKSDELNKKRNDLNKLLDVLSKNVSELNKKQAKSTTNDEQNVSQESKSNATKTNVNNAKLDSFYEKYKFSNHNKKKDVNNCKEIDESYLEVNYCSKCDPNQQKSIIIDNTKTKYCMKCSGIFETDDCSYCSKLSASSSNYITCQTCALHFCCDLALSTHTNIHN